MLLREKAFTSPVRIISANSSKPDCLIVAMRGRSTEPLDQPLLGNVRHCLMIRQCDISGTSIASREANTESVSHYLVQNSRSFERWYFTPPSCSIVTPHAPHIKPKCIRPTPTMRLTLEVKGKTLPHKVKSSIVTSQRLNTIILLAYYWIDDDTCIIGAESVQYCLKAEAIRLGISTLYLRLMNDWLWTTYPNGLCILLY